MSVCSDFLFCFVNYYVVFLFFNFSASVLRMAKSQHLTGSTFCSHLPSTFIFLFTVFFYINYFFWMYFCCFIMQSKNPVNSDSTAKLYKLLTIVLQIKSCQSKSICKSFVLLYFKCVFNLNISEICSQSLTSYIRLVCTLIWTFESRQKNWTNVIKKVDISCLITENLN